MHDTTLTANPAVEDTYWRDSFRSRPYVARGANYDDYGPAYRYGADARDRHGIREWEDAESDVSRDWERFKGTSKLSWEHAKAAVRDSWNRMTF